MAETKNQTQTPTKGIFGSFEQAIADSILTPQGGVVKAVEAGISAEALRRKQREEELLAKAAAEKAAASAPVGAAEPTMFTDGVYDPEKASFSQKIFHALFGG